MERMEEAFAAGNMLCAAGFDVVLRGEDPATLTAQKVAEKIACFVENAKKTREKIYPQLKGLEKMSDEEFVKALPNYCSVL